MLHSRVAEYPDSAHVASYTLQINQYKKNELYRTREKTLYQRGSMESLELASEKRMKNYGLAAFIMMPTW